MIKPNNAIPMLERWKNDPIQGEVIGHIEFSDEEKIENEKYALGFMVRQGLMTQEQADRDLDKLYEELGMLVLQ